MTGTIRDFTLDFGTKEPRMTLAINEKNEAAQLYDELKGCDKLTISIKKYRKRRSLNANSYAWVLCEKLAEALNTTKEEIYRHQIREVGVCKVAELSPDIADTVTTAWSMLGVGWFSEEAYRTESIVAVMLYYGSSSYNTKQMARLIDNLVGECKEQGIETLSPAELENMKSLWEAADIGKYSSEK